MGIEMKMISRRKALESFPNCRDERNTSDSERCV